MLMPNQMLAMMASSCFTVISVIMSGAVIPFSAMAGPYKALSSFSVDRYVMAGALYHLLGDSRKNVAGLYGTRANAMRQLQYDTFPSVWQNAFVCLGFYLFYTIGGFLCLKHLSKERR